MTKTQDINQIARRIAIRSESKIEDFEDEEDDYEDEEEDSDDYNEEEDIDVSDDDFSISDDDGIDLVNPKAEFSCFTNLSISVDFDGVGDRESIMKKFKREVTSAIRTAVDVVANEMKLESSQIQITFSNSVCVANDDTSIDEETELDVSFFVIKIKLSDKDAEFIKKNRESRDHWVKVHFDLSLQSKRILDGVQTLDEAHNAVISKIIKDSGIEIPGHKSISLSVRGGELIVEVDGSGPDNNSSEELLLFQCSFKIIRQLSWLC